MTALAQRAALLRSGSVILAAGALLAAAAAVAAPSTQLLPGPQGAAKTLLAGLVLLAAFAVGYLRPVASLYALVALVVLEGAIRKWLVNDITVFLLKDFLALGVYGAVLPRLTRSEWRRPWWLVAPLAGIVVLAVLHVPRSESLSQAVIGLRAYVVYLPLLWVGPRLVASARRANALVLLVIGLGVVEALLATVQALSGPGVLNKLVSGALPGLITVQGVAYLRPSGTFMQVGVLAAFLFLAVLVAFGLVAATARGRLLWTGIAAPGLIAWGVVYASARSLFGSLLLALAVLAAWLLWRRRVVSLVLVLASLAAGVTLLFTGVPAVRGAVADLDTWWRLRGYERVTLTDSTGRRFSIYLRPGTVERAPPEGVPGIRHVSGRDGEGRDVFLTVQVKEKVLRDRPGDSSSSGGGIDFGASASVTSAPETVLAVDDEGNIIQTTIGNEGASPVGGFIGRAADFNAAGGEVGLWGDRVRPQLGLIADQRLLGHGTGTMTLGSGYADEGATVLQGEGMYTKLAWELGLPGLALFVWLLGAIVLLAARGVARAEGWQRVLAFVGLGAAALLAPWHVLTFALDFPVVAVLFWLFAGCAVAYGSGSAPRRA